MSTILTRDIMNRFDKDGNTAVVMCDSIGNAVSIEFGGRITLKIVSEGNRTRNLGYIKDDSLHVTRDDEHIFRKLNAFGFNFNLLKRTDIFSSVTVIYRGLFYRIPKKTIIDFGKVMNFKNSSDGNSFELQIFVPIDIIKHYKIDIENAVQNRENSAE